MGTQTKQAGAPPSTTLYVGSNWAMADYLRSLDAMRYDLDEQEAGELVFRPEHFRGRSPAKLWVYVHPNDSLNDEMQDQIDLLLSLGARMVR